MELPLYTHMQAAVDIVTQSPHPDNKIAATIAGVDHAGAPFSLSRTNYWPDAIVRTIGTETPIGNSSGTIHAETACILHAPRTAGASLFITDPPCPNCMKNMAEAGIKALYIDHKGFDKDWAARRGESFNSMSMRIAEKAGLDVFVVYRKEQRFEVISRHPPGYKPAVESPPCIAPFDGSFDELIAKAHGEMKDEPFALAVAEDAGGKRFSILTIRHPTIGYTSETMEKRDVKYSFILHPLARALMIAAREGLKIEPGQVYSSRVPTARELVNLVGAGISQLRIGDLESARDEDALKALEQLTDAKILLLV